MLPGLISSYAASLPVFYPAAGSKHNIIPREPLLVHGRKSKAAAAFLGLWQELHQLIFPGEKPVHFIP
jgi:hypothetical protein